MIRKQELKGRFVLYLDEAGRQRTEKVIRVTGRTLTVRSVTGRRRRVKHDKVLGRMLPKKGLEAIEWNVRK